MPNEFEDLDEVPSDVIGQTIAKRTSHWKHLLSPLSDVQDTPPTWVVQGLLVPGMNLVAAPPKSFKSTLVLELSKAVAFGDPCFGKPEHKALARGSVIYFAAEQSAGSIKHTFEGRILGKKFQKGKTVWDFAVAKDPWEWSLGGPPKPFVKSRGGEKPAHSFEELIRDWKPRLLIIDPLIHFHDFDENDPMMIRPLVPLRKAMLKLGGALVIVHHSRKESPGSGGKAGSNAVGNSASWDKVRGTSALWAMADGGLLLNRSGPSVNIVTEFKDYPGKSYTWCPHET